MEVKGSSMVSLREFVKLNFGEAGYKKWLESLPPDAQKQYTNAIISSSWYPLKECLSEPTQKICSMFYSNDLRGAWDAGRHSAETGLNGIYKFFMQLANPQFIIKKAGSILPTYYKPSIMRASENGPKGAIVDIIEFPEMSDVIEKRVGGWMEKAIEICGCKNVKVVIEKSLLKKDDRTRYAVSWE